MFFGSFMKIKLHEKFLRARGEYSCKLSAIGVQVELLPAFRYNTIQVMSKKKEKLEKIVNGVLESREEELYLLRWEKRGSDWVLEVLLDKEGSVTTSDCASASERISAGLDEARLIDRKYELQVSSPGLERPLIESRHFEGAIDSLIEVKTYGPIEGSREFTGVLKNYDSEEKKIELEWEGEPLNIPLSQVAKASTKITEEEVD